MKSIEKRGDGLVEKKKLNVALIAGGKSGEREVSLKGAAGVEKALDSEKFTVKRYDPVTDLGVIVKDADNIDVAFILLHGLWGEDGSVQGFLDLLDIPYQCSGVLGSAMAMDKNVAKIMYQQAGLPVADWLIVSRRDTDNPDRLIDRFGFPIVVKPVREGSSLGMSIATNAKELRQGIIEAFKHDSQVMVEQYIKGREITVGVLGNEQLQPLPVVEIIPGKEFTFFDYTAKYVPGASKEICPAELETELTQKAQQYGVEAHQCLGLQGYSRTDMMISEDGELYLLETNTIPGMTPTSLLPQAAAEFGLDFPAFLEVLIYQAAGK